MEYGAFLSRTGEIVAVNCMIVVIYIYIYIYIQVPIQHW
jgi:hypothetical protein